MRNKVWRRVFVGLLLILAMMLWVQATFDIVT